VHRESKLETVYDWVTVAVFGGLAVLFLQRSSEDEPRDKITHYIPPAVGCAVSNFLGNEGYTIPAVGLLVAVMAYIQFVLKPFDRSGEGTD
jgi:hypothetical protein